MNYNPWKQDWARAEERPLLQAVCVDAIIHYYNTLGFTHQLESALQYMTNTTWTDGEAMTARSVLMHLSQHLPDGHEGDQELLLSAIHAMGLTHTTVEAYTHCESSVADAPTMVRYLNQLSVTNDVKRNESLQDSDYCKIHPLIISIEAMTDSVLITDKGNQHYYNIGILEDAGFRHRTEEYDGGCPVRCSITSQKGKIYYG